ncbi:Mu transposase domain-containing protein [Streptomyces sp. NPDC090798]|uniref:Mu transposase domain-containing protein n=1 Tax=Streptomyces sp. NPDC090798 TaxID=3365968 RepID=UPI00382BF3E6
MPERGRDRIRRGTVVAEAAADTTVRDGRLCAPRVGRYSQISVRTNHCSVPIRLIGRRVWVMPHASELVVHDDRVEIARHERLMTKADSRLVPDHCLEALVREPEALPGSTALEQARSAGKFTPGLSSRTRSGSRVSRP